MPFHITCSCGQLTVVPDDAAGQTIPCAHCNAALAVPQVAAPLPPPVPESLLNDDDGATVQDEPIIEVATDAPHRRTTQDPHQRTVRLSALILAGLALFSAIPVAVALSTAGPTETTSWLGGQVLEPWAMAIVLLAILHVAYILYLLQLPDHSSVRVVSVFLLVVSTSYAVFLGIRMLASPGNAIMEKIALDGNQFSSHQESLWCFLMLTLTGISSYVIGRAASQWQRH